MINRCFCACEGNHRAASALHLHIQPRNAETMPDSARQAEHQPLQRQRLRTARECRAATRHRRRETFHPNLVSELHDSKVAAFDVHCGQHKKRQSSRVVDEGGNIRLKSVSVLCLNGFSCWAEGFACKSMFFSVRLHRML